MGKMSNLGIQSTPFPVNEDYQGMRVFSWRQQGMLWLSSPCRGFTHLRAFRPKQIFYSRLNTSERFFSNANYLRYYRRQISSASASAEGAPSTRSIKDDAKRTRKHKWIWIGSFSSLVGALFIWDYYYNARTLSRNTRTVWNGMMLVLDYK